MKLTGGDIVAIKLNKSGKYLSTVPSKGNMMGFIPADIPYSSSWSVLEENLLTTKNAWWTVSFSSGRIWLKNIETGNVLRQYNTPTANLAYSAGINSGEDSMFTLLDAGNGASRLKLANANAYLGTTYNFSLQITSNDGVPILYTQGGELVPIYANNDITDMTLLSIKKLNRAACCMRDTSWVNSDICGNWWGNSDYCDPFMLSYCSTNPTDPACSCLSDKLSDPKLGINPKCINPACLRSGYLTVNMKSTPCPPIISCEMQTIIQNSGVSLGATTVTPLQACGGSSVPSTQPNNTQIPSGDSVTFSTTQLIMVIIFLLVIGIAILLTVYFYEDEKNGGLDNPYQDYLRQT